MAGRRSEQISEDDDSLFDAAARWALRLRDGDDPDVERAYHVWLGSDPVRANAVAEAQALLKLAIGSNAAPVSAPLHRGRRPWRLAAGSVAILSVLMIGLSLSPDILLTLRGYEQTGTGELRAMTLADGSRVVLDSGTALRVDMDEGQRHVRLDHGRAFFEVTHDPSRPFSVETSMGTARVLGTVFTVRADADSARVGLLSGAVAVQAKQGNSQRTLHAGEGARLFADRVDADPAADPVADAVWRQKRLTFYRAPLSEAVGEIARYRHLPLYIRRPDDASPRLSGVFDISDPDAALEMVIQTLGARAIRIAGKPVIIY